MDGASQMAAAAAGSAKLESFVDVNFLRAQTLSEKNVLSYFYSSKFFDTNSLNQKRRRGIHVPEGANGIEYRVLYANAAARNLVQLPPIYEMSAINQPNQFGVFVIQMVLHKNGVDTPLKCYYVIGGTIYPSPSFAEIIYSRLQAACRNMNQMLGLCQGMDSWSPLSGHVWRAPIEEDKYSKQSAALNGDAESGSSEDESDEDYDNEDNDEGGFDLWGLGPPLKGGDGDDAAANNRWGSRSLLSKRRLRMVPWVSDGVNPRLIVMFSQKETPHYTEVVQDEYTRLLKTNTRLAKLFTDEVQSRQFAEMERRNHFAGYFKWLENIEMSIYKEHKQTYQIDYWLTEGKETDKPETETETGKTAHDGKHEAQETPNKKELGEIEKGQVRTESEVKTEV